MSGRTWLSCVTVLCALLLAPAAAAQEAPPPDDDFAVTTLAKGADKTGEPIALAVLPDRRVLHTSRDGRVWLTTPNATTSLAATIPVYSHDEDGLQGIAVDPDFATNRWVYLYYAPPLDTPAGDAPTSGSGPEAFEPFEGHNQLSRMKLTETGTLDLSTEQEILRVPTDRGICCHNGGEIDFDAEGNLYLSTGDDTNPFESDGYAPIDERATRNPAFDAQRSSANTNDLRGKLLRIKVNADGSYTSPAGNLFPAGQMGTRPEIYAMGFRNPFRFAVDEATGWVYLGDYGPDAGGPDPDRGPGGQSSSTSSRSRATTAGPTATARATPTTTTTSPPASPAPSSTAPRRSTSPRATPASTSCRPRSPRGSPTTGAASPSSAAAASRRWAARPTTSTPPTRPPRNCPSTTTARTSPTSSAAAGSARCRSTRTAPCSGSSRSWTASTSSS